MIRRSSWTHYHADAVAVARQVADWMSALLQWTPEQTAGEIERYRAIVRSSTCVARE